MMKMLRMFEIHAVEEKLYHLLLNLNALFAVSNLAKVYV